MQSQSMQNAEPDGDMHLGLESELYQLMLMYPCSALYLQWCTSSFNNNNTGMMRINTQQITITAFYFQEDTN